VAGGPEGAGAVKLRAPMLKAVVRRRRWMRSHSRLLPLQAHKVMVKAVARRVHPPSICTSSESMYTERQPTTIA
jgi:hypothetical protein